jgi:hypothetical protein
LGADTSNDLWTPSRGSLFWPSLQLRVSLEGDNRTVFELKEATFLWRILTCSRSFFNLISKSFLSGLDILDNDRICDGTPNVSYPSTFKLMHFLLGAKESPDAVISVSTRPELPNPSDSAMV